MLNELIPLEQLVLLLERMIEEKDWERIDNLQLAGR